MQKRATTSAGDAGGGRGRAGGGAGGRGQRFLAEVKSGNFPKPDIFAFAMGTNDLTEFIGDADKALLGKELSGNDNIDLFTVAGAARLCIQTIQENFPEARVCVMTPILTATPAHN